MATGARWVSVVIAGRDHRPDKKQIAVGLTELSNPINIPIGMTVREGNVNDQVHFEDTYDPVKDRLCEGLMVVLDPGGNRKDNLDRIENSKLKYLTARQLNKSDEDTGIENFDKSDAELVDERYGVYGLRKRFPSRVNYLFFSEDLYEQQMASKLRKVERLFDDSREDTAMHRG